MVTKMAREFIGITKHLLEQPQPWVKDGRLLVPRETLIEMLDKHAYLTSTEKLTLWRKLHWIDAEQDHFTRRLRCDDGTVKRVIMLDLSAYEGLCEMRAMPTE